VALLDAARGLFEVGPAHEMLEPERLGRLYGRKVRIANVEGQIAIVVGEAPEGRESAHAAGGES
jgi:hypothetical protein